MSAVHVLAGPSLAANTEPYKSGPIGLAIILILLVACFFLFRSMSRHMRNVRENFPGVQRDAMGRVVAPAAPPAGSSAAGPAAEPAPADTDPTQQPPRTTP
jgi:hypothetical protein